MENSNGLKIAVLADATHVNCQRWCEGLRLAGADIHLISFNLWRSSGLKTYQLPISPLPYKLHYFAAVPHVRRLLTRIQPDVVLAYYVTGYGTLGALTGFHPLVQITSGSDVLIAPDNPIMKSLLRYTLSRADLVTAWAPHMAAAAQALGVADERIFVLPRGIPFRQFAGARCRRPGNDSALSIICTRTFKTEYNIDLLLRVARLLHEKTVKFSLTLAGTGPEREKLILLTRELGLKEQVRFAGFVPNDELPTLLSQHDLYVSLVESDGVSASLMETMAAGLLPIVPNHPANRLWIKSGENGLLLDDLSVAGVASMMARAISDLPLRQRAWEHNSELIRARADLQRNAEIFVGHFRQLARGYRNQYCSPAPFAGN